MGPRDRTCYQTAHAATFETLQRGLLIKIGYCQHYPNRIHNVHVSQTATSLGINFQPLPPKDQSLNLAEKAIDIIMHAAVGHLLQSKRHSKYFPQALDFACYSHNRMATTASRNWITPFEALKGFAPDVSHMWSFGTVCYVVVDKPNRPNHKGTKELEQPAVKGIFLGFHTMWNDTYKAITDEARGTVVHSRHITFNRDSFDYSDVGGPLASSSMLQSELLGLVDLALFHESEEPRGDNTSSKHSAQQTQNDSQSDMPEVPQHPENAPENISQQQQEPSQQNSPASQNTSSHSAHRSQNHAPDQESMRQPQSPNGKIHQSRLFTFLQICQTMAQNKICNN